MKRSFPARRSPVAAAVVVTIAFAATADARASSGAMARAETPDVVAAAAPAAAAVVASPPPDPAVDVVPVTAPVTAPVAALDTHVDLLPDAACGDGLRLLGTDLCTHGDDTGHQHAEAANGGAPAPGTAAAPARCDTSAPQRVQAVYAYVSGRPNRAAELTARIRQWAGVVEQTFRASSNGTRAVRWVTNDRCEIDVVAVAVSDQAAGSFPATVRELAGAGLDRGDRRYLVWFDASAYCGIATLAPDDRADPSNRNNGGAPAFARIDAPCWGGYTEAHELVHMLGGVQRSAPNATRLGHCSDESDLLCYPDERGVAMRQVCGRDRERLLDCRGDDYFNVAPAAGSYLQRHWNVANSAFLIGAPAGPATVEHRLEGALSPLAPIQRNVVPAGAGAARVFLRHANGTSTDAVGVALAAVEATGRGQAPAAVTQPAAWTVRVLDPAGRMLVERRGVEETIDVTLSLPAPGSHTVEVATDGSGSWSAIVTVRRP